MREEKKERIYRNIEAVGRSGCFLLVAIFITLLTTIAILTYEVLN